MVEAPEHEFDQSNFPARGVGAKPSSPGCLTQTPAGIEGASAATFWDFAGRCPARENFWAPPRCKWRCLQRLMRAPIFAKPRQALCDRRQVQDQSPCMLVGHLGRKAFCIPSEATNYMLKKYCTVRPRYVCGMHQQPLTGVLDIWMTSARNWRKFAGKNFTRAIMPSDLFSGRALMCVVLCPLLKGLADPCHKSRLTNTLVP